MNILVTTDDSGRLTGVYGGGVSPLIPLDAVQLSEADGEIVRQAKCLGHYLLLNGAIVQDDAMLLADTIRERQAEVDALAVQKRGQVVGAVSPYEAASWPIKRAEALAFQASGNVADAPGLSAEAVDGGISIDVLVAKVLAKAAAYAAAEARISGVNRRHRDALALLTTKAEAEAYDITAGWTL